MALLSIANPTLMDLANRQDPEGKIAMIVEILNQNNEILDDMTFIEANGKTAHDTTVRTGLPAPTWRKLYGGVQPTKSTTAKIKDTMGMLEAYAEVDKALADLSGNPAQFRMTEDMAHLEGMSQEMADTLFFGNEGTEPEAFTGFAPRFNSLSAENGDNIIDAGGAGSDNRSIWLVVWGPNTCHGIIPQGSVSGIQQRDMGEVTVENIDGSNGRAQMYRTHYRFDGGLTVRDWRYVVRIANIDKSDLTKDASAGADLIDLMTQAIERIPGFGIGRPAFYMPRDLRSFLRRQLVNKVAASTLTMEEVAGKKVVAFDGIPCRRVDRLAANEAQIT